MWEKLFSNKIVALMQIIGGIVGIFEGAAYLYEEKKAELKPATDGENEETE